MNSKLRLLAIASTSTLALSAFAAELRDAPPVDTAQVSDFLGKLKRQHLAALQQRRTTAFETIKGVVSNGEKAAALWKEAVKTVQFDGAEDEQAQLRAWRDNEGDAFNSKEVQNAARLHLTWLFYTLQFKSGVKKKDLLPLVIEYTNQLVADGQTMDTHDTQLQKDKEREASSKHGVRRDEKPVKQIHDSILNASVSDSPVAKYLGLEDVLPRALSKDDRMAKSVARILGNAKVPVAADDSWPMAPGDLEAIQQSIILPEYRLTKDPRILDYWDRVLTREGDLVAKRKIDYEEKRFVTVRRPEILWARAEDFHKIGLINRAITEMVTVLRTNPLHPRAEGWISQLESLLPTGGKTSSAPPPADAPLAPPSAAK